MQGKTTPTHWRARAHPMIGRIIQRMVGVLVAALLLAPLGRPANADSASGPITVFAAASLKTALDQISDHITTGQISVGQNTAAQNATEQTSGPIPLRLSYAGTATLARQITLGAPADVLIAASPDWMDYVAARTPLYQRSDLLTNTLVLIAQGSAPPVDLTEFDIAAALDGGRLAMALVDAVPAGIYGKAALKHLGQWDVLAPHVAQSDNVRSALALVATGAAPYGIVYASDAAADPRVSVIARFPPDSHPPIVYPIAALGPSDQAADVITLLHSDAAAAIFRANGFGVLP